MRKIPVDRLKPGMIIGRSVCNVNGQVLLARGIELNDIFIKRLSLLDIPAVYIDDGFLLGPLVEDVVSEETRYRAMEITKKVFQDFQYSRCLSGLDKIEKAVDMLIGELLENNTLMVNLSDIRSQDNYTFGHSVNTCILSLITAIHMGYSEKKLYLLAMGALLHDLGKTLVPQEILNKPDKLTDEEYEMIKTHSESGYRLLASNKNFHSISSLVALQHHERYNGSGYPNGLAGDQIHEFSTIVGVADVYDALTADRVYRKSLPAHEAFEMIAATGDYLFDHKVVKAFLYHIAAYPVGVLVKLSNGQIGVVIKNRPGLPSRPMVKVLFDERNEPMADLHELDLGEHLSISVLGVVEDESTLELYKQKLCTV